MRAPAVAGDDKPRRFGLPAFGEVVDHGVSPILGQVEGLFPLVCLTTINIRNAQIFVKPPCVAGVAWG